MTDTTPARLPILKLKLSLPPRNSSTASSDFTEVKGRAESLEHPSISEARPSTIRLALPIPKPDPLPISAPTNTTPTQAISTAPSRSSGPSKKRTPKTKLSSRKQPSKAPLTARPSAIPPRLLSTAPSTPKSQIPTSLPSSPDVNVESSTSPGLLAGSDGVEVLSNNDQGEGSLTPKTEVEEKEYETAEGVVGIQNDGTAPVQVNVAEEPGMERGRPVVKWARLKKPLKELCGKIMIELRRKDEYAYFDEPVDIDEYPEYVSIVGGEANLMDLGTMQNKIDDGIYRSMDSFEADLRTLVRAAQLFNLPGSKPYTTAARILEVGLRNINRLRPTVKTPSPTPVRRDRMSASESSTPFRGQSTFSALARDQEPESTDHRKANDIPPEYYIPEQMLSYPPNSLSAMAVGWNLNGGKRQHARRFIRGREKFSGKWRHWSLDGSRDVGEMEDPEHVLRSVTDLGLGNKRMIDWRAVRTQSKSGVGYWDFELGGPHGQAPIPFTPYPRPSQLPTRELRHLDLGVYPEVDSEEAYFRSRLPNTTPSTQYNILGEQLRPTKPRVKVPAGGAKIPPSFVNAFEGGREAGEWLRDVCLGGVEGEAYLRSVDSFVDGALWSRSNASNSEGGASYEEKEGHDDVGVILRERIGRNWRNGVLHRGPREQVISAFAELKDLQQTISNKQLLSPRQEKLSELAKEAHKRLALRELTSTDNPLDIRSLLRDADDFLWMGHTKGKVTEGLRLVGDEIIRLNNEVLSSRVGFKEETKGVEASLQKGSQGSTQGDTKDSSKEIDAQIKDEDPDDSVLLPSKRKRSTRLSMSSMKKPKIELPPSTVSSPLSQPPDSPKAEFSVPGFGGEREEALKAMRLELISLSKFYPLAALRKMSAEEADRLLPLNVRGLMTMPAGEGAK